MTALCFLAFLLPSARQSDVPSVCRYVLSWYRKKIFSKNEMSVNLFTVWFVLNNDSVKFEVVQPRLSR